VLKENVRENNVVYGGGWREMMMDCDVK
jgi:hypothetical protein